MKTGITFEVTSDLYDAGRNEDGNTIHAEVFFVMAEADDGSRWTHANRHRSVNPQRDEDGEPYLEDCTSFAKCRAEADAAEAREALAAGTLDPERDWHSTAARYGSLMHCEADCYDEEERHRFLRF